MSRVKLYLQLILIQLQSMMEYRAVFLFGAVAQALAYGAHFLLIWVMVNKFDGIAGWSPYEVTLLYGLNLFSYSTAGIFCLNSFYGLGGMIRSGEFDNVLTKPLNPFLLISFRQFNYGYFSHLSLSGFVIALSWARLEIPVTGTNLLFLLVTLVSGALIQAAMFIFTGVPAFWIVRSEGLAEILMWDVGYFVRYPITVYNSGIQILLTLIVPYAFVSFYPVQFFLAKNDVCMFHPVFRFLSPVVGAAMFAAAYRFWRFGLDRYESTGS
jgi:ABC-2 type transport system permease protein